MLALKQYVKILHTINQDETLGIENTLDSIPLTRNSKDIKVVKCKLVRYQD